MFEDEDYQRLAEALPAPIRQHIDALERMRKDFVANVSHELRTPLTVMMGYLELLLQQNTFSPEQYDYLEKVHQQTNRMQKIIEDLLFLSHIELEQVASGSRKIVPVASLLQQVQQNLESLAQKKQQQLSLSVDSELTLLGNADELYSLFANIISNAIKYTGENGVIQVRWFQRDNQAIFEVSDTGIGIAAEHIPRLTERFYRVDKGRSRQTGGTGLGLAIAKHLLLRHRGQLQIRSELGRGSVFSCLFTMSA